MLFADEELVTRIERATLADPLVGKLLTARGCDVATVTTQPGSKSQHNTQRKGLELL